MKRIASFFSAAALSVTAIVLSASLLDGCASAPPTHFYTLQDGQAASNVPASRSLYLASLSLPERVDRPQIVVRKSSEQVQILEQQLWAEPLKQAFARNLSAHLGQHGIALQDSRHGVAQLSVDVLNFESWPGKHALLEVVWQIKNAEGKLLLRQQMSWTEASPGADTAALVAAHRRALAQCAQAIAQSLNSLPVGEK